MSVPVLFEFRSEQGASLVEVAGSFNNWTRVPMSKRGHINMWSLAIKLAPGQYEYKYIDDDEWRLDQEKQTKNDNMGNLNNIIMVEENDDNDTVEFISTGGAGIHQKNRMGIYIKTNQQVRGHPVFEQVIQEEGKEKYFLFVDQNGYWGVGTFDSSGFLSKTDSSLKHPKNNSSLPSKSGWRYHLNDEWNEDDSLQVIVNVKNNAGETLAGSQTRKQPTQDVKAAIMEACEADFKKLNSLGSCDDDMTVDDYKEKFMELEEQINFDLGFTSKTALMVSAESGLGEVCKVLLSAGADVNKINRVYGKQETALMWAAKGGWPEVCEILLAAGADINQKINILYGTTALDIAKENEKFKVVEVLEKHGAVGATASEIELQQKLQFHTDSDSEITLHEWEELGLSRLPTAACNGNKEACRLLIEAGLNVNCPDINGKTALLEAIENGFTDIYKMLVEAGADIEKPDRFNCTALHLCCDKGNVDMIKMLISAGADVNKRDCNMLGRRTALNVASCNGATEIVKILIEAGANLELAKKDGCTALIEAAREGHTEICRLLIEAGAEVDKERNDGWTALICAAFNKNTETCKTLIEAGASVEKVYNAERTNQLCRMDSLILTQFLEQFNLTDVKVAIMDACEADFERLNQLGKVENTVDYYKELFMCMDKNLGLNGITALEVAAGIGFGEVCKVLISAGADVNEIQGDNTPGIFNSGEEVLTTALTYALYGGWPETCEILIAAGADVNQKTLNEGYGYTALDIAKFNKNIEVVKALEKYGAKIAKTTMADILRVHGISLSEIDKRLEEGDSPLLFAAKIKNKDACRLLIEAGADVNGTDENTGKTALMWAAQNGSTDIYKMLIEAGADINKVDNYGKTALTQCCEEYDGDAWVDIAKMLLSSGAEVNKITDYGETALYWASSEGSIEIVKMLIEAGADLDIAETGTQNSTNNPLHQSKATALNTAAKRGSTEICKLLVEAGADVNGTDGNTGKTALMWAAENGSTDIYKMLIEAGADKRLKEGDSPLLFAAKKQNKDACKLLIDAGADVNGTDENTGETALMWAAENGSTDIYKMLIEAGADINKVDDDGKTALTWCCEDYDGDAWVDIAKMLLSSGAEVNKIPDNGKTALYLASSEGSIEIVKMLIEAGADLDIAETGTQNSTDNPLYQSGATALIRAAKEGFIEICKLLVAAGAEIDKEMNGGWTALMWAAFYEHTETCTMLIKAGASMEKVNKAHKDADWEKEVKQFLEKLGEELGQ